VLYIIWALIASCNTSADVGCKCALLVLNLSNSLRFKRKHLCHYYFIRKSYKCSYFHSKGKHLCHYYFIRKSYNISYCGHWQRLSNTGDHVSLCHMAADRTTTGARRDLQLQFFFSPGLNNVWGRPGVTSPPRRKLRNKWLGLRWREENVRLKWVRNEAS
jgi:hypothetical protein